MADRRRYAAQENLQSGPRHVALSKQRQESEQDEGGDDQSDEEASRQYAHIAEVFNHETVIGAQIVFGDDLGRIGQQFRYILGVEGAFAFSSFELRRLQARGGGAVAAWVTVVAVAAEEPPAGETSALPSSTAP